MYSEIVIRAVSKLRNALSMLYLLTRMFRVSPKYQEGMAPSPQSSLLVYGVLFELILMILPAHILELVEIISTISKIMRLI